MARFHENSRRQTACTGRVRAARPVHAKAAQLVMAGVLGLLAGCATQEADRHADEDPDMSTQDGAGRQTRQAEPAGIGHVETAPVARTPLKGTAWRLQSLGGQPVSGDGEMPTLTLQADNDGFGGFSGCNRYFGSYRLDEHQHMISFAGVGVTKRMCGIAQMRREGAFLAVLRNRIRLVVQDEVLAFFDEGGRELARFRAATAGTGTGTHP